MGAISAVGSQIPIPSSINGNAASNPISDLGTQKNLSELNNAGSAASNATAQGKSMVQGIIGNLGPTNKV